MKNLKLVLIVVLSFISFKTYASRECEDVKNYSVASTALSAEVYNYSLDKKNKDADSKILALAQKMIQELDESLAINSHKENPIYNSIKDGVENRTVDTAADVLRLLKQKDLQLLNNLRVAEMTEIRTRYELCF